MKFDKDDPLADLHVPRWKRKNRDGGKGSDATQGGTDADFDRDEVRANEVVVDEEDLK